MIKNRFNIENYKGVQVLLSREDIRIINNALCLYGNVLNNFDMFNTFNEISLNEGDKVVDLMEKIGKDM